MELTPKQNWQTLMLQAVREYMYDCSRNGFDTITSANSARKDFECLIEQELEEWEFSYEKPLNAKEEWGTYP
jgi:hypothetical protein